MNQSAWWMQFILLNALVALSFGAAVVVLVFGLNLIVALIWLGLLIRSVSSRNGNRAIAAIFTQLAVMTLVVTAAANAPMKTTDRFLDRTIEVPKTVMTLMEIAGDPNEPQPEWRPYSVRLRVPPDEKAKQIDFRATKITLREFVNAVESQSTLRHRFGHCGNGSTILWGGDCSFGLLLRRPND